MAAEQNIGLGSGFLGSLNEQQETALIELKERIKDVESLVNHPDGDVYLLRFLRATMKKGSGRNFQVDSIGRSVGAYERLMQTVEFEERFNVHEKPECYAKFEKMKPSICWTDPKAQNVVVNEKVGYFWTNCDPGLLSMDEWTRCIAYTMEQRELAVRELRRKYELDDSPRLVAIQDLEGIGFGARRMLPVFRIFNQIGELYHPELVKKVYVFNATVMLRTILTVASRIVDPITMNKVKVVKRPEALLNEGLAEAQLPEEYGGLAANPPVTNCKDKEQKEQNVCQTSEELV